MKAIIVLAITSCFVLGTLAFSSGNGITQRCSTMEPNHGDSTKQDNANAPYMVTAAAATYMNGGKIAVMINGTEAFKGFMLQARKPDGTIVGTWDLNSQTESQVQMCSNNMDVVTHAGAGAKMTKMFYWMAPAAYGTGTIKFYASFVKEKPGDYYVMIPSAELMEKMGPAPGRGNKPALTFLATAVLVLNILCFY